MFFTLLFMFAANSMIRFHDEHYLEDQVNDRVAVFWNLDASMMVPTDHVLRHMIGSAFELKGVLHTFSDKQKTKLFSQMQWEWVHEARAQLFQRLRSKGAAVYGLHIEKKDSLFFKNPLALFHILKQLGAQFTEGKRGEERALFREKEWLAEKGILVVDSASELTSVVRLRANKSSLQRVFVISAALPLLTQVQQGVRCAPWSYDGFLLDSPSLESSDFLAKNGKKQLEHFIKTGEWQADSALQRAKIFEEKRWSTLRFSNRWFVPKAH